MFRANLGRRVWHFCTNCPHWPDHADYEAADVAPPFRQWCRTCVRMVEADTCDQEWPESDVVTRALEDAWSSGRLKLRR